MKRLVNFLMLSAILGLIAFGCGTQPNPVDSNDFSLPTAQKIVIPDGAVFESATLNIYIEEFSNQTINVHRITAPWDEYTVTWNSFDGSYDAAVEASFTDDAIGWKTVDFTALFQGWFDNTYANYGFLLTEDEYAHITSKEASFNMPYITICYNLDNELVCVDDLPVGDTYIFESSPDENYGHSTVLKVGLADYSTPIEKQTLIRFETEEITFESGCTNTIGYWKTHAGFGPQEDDLSQYLPIWLGTANGDKSLYVDNALMAVNILKEKTFGFPDNGITKLYAQMLAAKLNMAAGADHFDIAEALADADAFLADHDWTDWGNLSGDDKDFVLMLQGTFDDYNNGFIGPGHCEDSYDGKGDDDSCDKNSYFRNRHHNNNGHHKK